MLEVTIVNNLALVSSHPCFKPLLPDIVIICQFKYSWWINFCLKSMLAASRTLQNMFRKIFFFIYIESIDIIQLLCWFVEPMLINIIRNRTYRLSLLSPLFRVFNDSLEFYCLLQNHLRGRQ